MRVRPWAWAVHGALVAGLIAAPIGYVLAEKTVTLDVNGSAVQVQTRASTVGDVLVENGLKVLPRDAISPSSPTEVIDGLRVAVISARPVLLIVDGASRELWTTATTVSELSSQLGSRYNGAYLSVSRSARIPLSGLTMEARLPKAVSINDAGKTTDIVTTAPTWAATIAEAGVVVRPTDVLSVAPTTAPVDGQRVTVTRVDLRSDEVSVPIAFPSVRRPDPTHYIGTTSLLRAGVSGRLVVRYVTTLRNGKAVKRVVAAKRVAVPPIPQIIGVGTKAKPKPVVHPSTGVGGLNWAALARCESGGNPRAIGGGGNYFGLYQFSLGTWRAMGGSGNPIDASVSEQTYRAQLLYKSQGRSPWPYCGRFL